MGGVFWRFGGVYMASFPESWNLSPLQKFSSYDQLYAFLNKSSNPNVYYSFREGTSPGSLSIFGQAAQDASKISDYSTTNIQVAGVDEADIVKTDGRYIYSVSGTTVFIIQAYPNSTAKVIAKLGFNQTVTGIFIANNRMVVFHGASNAVPSALINRFYPQPSSYMLWTSIEVYDTTDKSTPVLKRTVSVDGYYFTSRMIDDYVYTIFTQPIYILNREVTLPTISVDGQIMKVPATSIYYVNASDYYYGYSKVVSLNIQNIAQEPAYETLLVGSASDVYVSQTNLYLVLPGKGDVTNVHKIGIQDGKMAYVANGTVLGRVLNQFSMDEYNGYFRVATTSGWPSSSSVYVLDQKLRLVGRLEGLAPGESMHSARFIGDRCYLVTFKNTDPLFVIDVKDPSNPRVLGELKIPGYSDYLQPYDETHLIGIGKETVESQMGDFAWYQGVKISLFDVSDVLAPKEISKAIIGDRGTDSPVLRDAKALLFSRSRNLLVIPVLVAKIDESNYPGGVPPNAYGTYVWQGAFVYSISAETGLILRGTISQTNAASTQNSVDKYSSSYEIKRSLYIEDVLYTISDNMVKMNDLGSLEELGTVQLIN
ncbi:beta-propeller domain-containing protein [Candidatus Bathyarchaeota archaeon]|nr:beta-propeller domain-containing protein [Candidatus Bathyarchaeota archaeon]